MSKNTNDLGPMPAPRQTATLIGHEKVEAKLANTFEYGRMAHALLLAGPRGIGKATLAYRFARHVLSSSTPDMKTMFTEKSDKRLTLSPDNEVFARVASGGHADLLVLEKGINPRTGRLRGEITVDKARQLGRFLCLTPVESSWRICIVDAVDEMNLNAANAILKSIEEPPPRTILILVSHAPGRLSATIRSRCQQLNLRPLSQQNFRTVIKTVHPELKKSEIITLAQLSEGSPGRALVIAELDGIQLYQTLVSILITVPAIDFESVHAFADELSRKGSEGRFNLAMELLLGWLSCLVRTGAQKVLVPDIIKGEGAARERFISVRGLDHWAELWENINRLFIRSERVHLDRKQVLLSAYTAIGDLAQA